MERLADYVIGKLTQIGIKHIFLITGRGILYLTDAVAKNEDILGVSTYHEQGASYAAMAYAAITGGMSVCLVSTGCAATNAVTAALCAFQDNLPVIFISGQNMLSETTRHTGIPIRTYGSQEADIIKIVESITKYSAMIENPNDIVYEMDKAIYMANEGRKGPVWIDIPLDIQNARVDPTVLKKFVPASLSNDVMNFDIVDIVKSLEASERPIIFVGGGVRSADAVEELKLFVQKCKIPVVFSTSAADIYGTGNALSIGAVGSIGGSRAGNFAVQNSDFVLVIGSKLCSQSVGDDTQFARRAKIVVIDIDQNEHTKKGVRIDKIVNADAKLFLKRMLESHIDIDCSEWLDKCKRWKSMFAVSKEHFIGDLISENKIDIYHFSDTISDLISNRATVITDAGFEELIVPSTIKFKDEQRCLFSASQGAMGYAIPAIIGAYFAGREDIVAIIGDGSFMMNMQELQIIKTHNIPAKIFIINNDMYAVIRKRQHDLFRTRTIGNDPSDGLPAPNYKSIAESFSFEYVQINDEKSLIDGVDNVLNRKQACICEVNCVKEQNYLHVSFAINEKRKLVKRPLEDMSPFIDREVLKREMVIEVMDE